MWMREALTAVSDVSYFILFIYLFLDSEVSYLGWTHSLSIGDGQSLFIGVGHSLFIGVGHTHSHHGHTHSHPAGNTQVATRKNEIVNRLEKTKKWEEPDLQAALIQRQREERTEKAREVSFFSPSPPFLPPLYP